MTRFLTALLVCGVPVAFAAPLAFAAPVTAQDGVPAVGKPPNIVLLLCDDLGYGDVRCLNPEHGRIATPNLDSLAAAGMTFTDAHSGSSVCTPTRYGLLTGRYSWRTTLQKGVTVGFEPCLIDEDRPTVAGFLKQQGYQTGIVGKWHLNFQYADAASGKLLKKKDVGLPPVSASIPDGPLTRGFDFFHGFHHARDMKAVIENDTVIAHDDPINMLPRIAAQSVAFVQRAASDDKPFFLYVPFGSPHTPILPTEDWKGRSGLGDYADFVMQTDDAVGQILKAIDTSGVRDNTLVIFSSDNGCSKAAGIGQLAELGHNVSGPYRGSKADLWDGGHRVPLFVRWPGNVMAGSECDQLICLTDVFATVADVVTVPVPQGSCEDSVSFLPAFSGRPIPDRRRGIVHHSVSGHFAYRTQRWKLLLARGSGGWTSPKENQVPAGTLEAQLYDMTIDSGEQTNLIDAKPEIVEDLLIRLRSDVSSGRSVAGPPSKNDVPLSKIELWKSGRGVSGAKKSGRKKPTSENRSPR